MTKLFEDVVLRFPSLPHVFSGSLAYIQIPATSYWDEVKNLHIEGS